MHERRSALFKSALNREVFQAIGFLGEMRLKVRVRPLQAAHHLNEHVNDLWIEFAELFAQRFLRRASFLLIAGRRGRPVTSESYSSQTAAMRASRGIASPIGRCCGVASGVRLVVEANHISQNALFGMLKALK